MPSASESFAFVGFLQALVDLQEVRAAVRLTLQRLHIAGVRINGLQGVADAAEQDAVRGLVEHGQAVVDPLEQDRHGSQGLRMLHHVADAPAVVVDIAAAEFLVRIRVRGEAGHIQHELRIVAFDLLQEQGLFGTLDGIVAQGVGGHFHVVALLEEEGGDLLVPVEQVDEFRAVLLQLGLVGEGAGGVRLHGVQHLVLVDIQELDDDGRIGLVLQGSVNDGLRAAGGQKEGRPEDGEDLNGFHTRQGWHRRWPSFPPGRG